MRKPVLLIAVALAASLFFETAALAAAAGTDTTFKMEDNGSSVTYSGRVSSNSDRCIKNRRVKIFHKGVNIANATTDADGKWSVEGPKPPDGDNVTAEVKKKRKNGKTICKSTSVTKTFNED
jgi:hypothetical protein